MINKTITLLTTILLLTSCSAKKKFGKLFTEGYTEQESFNVKIPFENKFGLIVIKVELNNETYDFILDSGATNVLSKELAKTLGNKGLFTVNNGDSQGNSQQLDITKIEEISIGGVKFAETGSGIIDFSQSIDIGCMEVDGIIGSNLMRLAVWKIDFRNQIITITNTKESLSLGHKTKKIPFYTYGEEDKPFCNVKINNVDEKNVIIDLGSNGGFSLSYSTYEKIQKELPKNKKAIEYGSGGSGGYGYGKMDSIYYLQAGRLSVGEIGLNNQIIKFSKSIVPTIGTAFFKNYDLVMNWVDKELLLSPHTDYENEKITHAGFNLNYQDDALRIATLIKESDAEKSGMQLGDKIIQINGKDYSNTSIDDYCDLIKQVSKDNYSIKNIVINRNGERLSFNIKSDVIIE